MMYAAKKQTSAKHSLGGDLSRLAWSQLSKAAEKLPIFHSGALVVSAIRAVRGKPGTGVALN